MIEETGRVVAREGDQVWVQTLQATACQSCSARKGCGQALLSDLSGGRARQLRVANVLDVAVGEDVVVGVPESALLRASVLLYLLPLLALIGAALAARHGLAASDGWVALAGFGGLMLGFLLVGHLSAASAPTAETQPRLLRRSLAPSAESLLTNCAVGDP